MGFDSIAMALTYNWDVVGHEKVLRALEGDIAQKNVSHAYLLSGPDNVGKFTVAQKLAHILQCEQGYCRECTACQEIDRGYHSDTLIMADDGSSVKIEQIRGVLERLNITKQSPYKVFLMENIERMTLESSNALLKTLEDPPQGVVFVLTTSRVKDVLPTIVSRVRLQSFHRLDDETMAKLIQEQYPMAEPQVVETVAAIALGRPGKALTLLGDRELYEQYRKMYADIEAFLRQPDRVNQFLYIEELAANAKESGQELIREFLDIFQLVLRKQLLMDVRGERGIFSRDKLLHLLEQAQKSQELLKRNVNTRLLLENMMLSL